MFKGKKFDVEHALNMYASSYVTLPAEAIYDKIAISRVANTVKDCHIYIIGFVPKIDLIEIKHEDDYMVMSFTVLGSAYDLRWDMPAGAELTFEGDTWYVRKNGEVIPMPSQELCMIRLGREYGIANFFVKYIGQAYGKSGKRNALDRLQKHETLQKIAVKGVPDGYRLQIVMLEIEASNKVITMFNPFADDSSSGEERINNGLQKLFNTSERERVALYEAALIRYFMPQFNIEFKNSFPSTNLEILRDCYDKDFSAVVAEIVFDDMPFNLFSEVVPAQDCHIVTHNLHTREERQVFFS